MIIKGIWPIFGRMILIFCVMMRPDIAISQKENAAVEDSMKAICMRICDKIKIPKSLQIAVSDFSQEGSTEVDAIGRSFGSMMTRFLSDCDKFILVNRSQMDKLSQEMHFQYTDHVDDRSRKTLGGFAAADALVLGDYKLTPNKIIIQIRLVDVEKNIDYAVEETTISAKYLEYIPDMSKFLWYEEIAASDKLQPTAKQHLEALIAVNFENAIEVFPELKKTLSQPKIFKTRLRNCWLMRYAVPKDVFIEQTNTVAGLINRLLLEAEQKEKELDISRALKDLYWAYVLAVVAPSNLTFVWMEQNMDLKELQSAIENKITAMLDDIVFTFTIRSRDQDKDNPIVYFNAAYNSKPIKRLDVSYYGLGKGNEYVQVENGVLMVYFYAEPETDKTILRIQIEFTDFEQGCRRSGLDQVCENLQTWPKLKSIMPEFNKEKIVEIDWNTDCRIEIESIREGLKVLRFRPVVQGNHTVQSYYWDFGDGSSSVAKEPVHTYKNCGNYQIKLILYGKSSCSKVQNVVVCDRLPEPDSNPCKRHVPSKLIDSMMQIVNGDSLRKELEKNSRARNISISEKSDKSDFVGGKFYTLVFRERPLHDFYFFGESGNNYYNLRSGECQLLVDASREATVLFFDNTELER